MVKIKHNQKVYRLPTEEEKQWCREHHFGYYIGSEDVDAPGYSVSDMATQEVVYTVFFSNVRRAAEIRSENYECRGCGFVLILVLVTILIALFA